jgi:hypothetical protein
MSARAAVNLGSDGAILDIALSQPGVVNIEAVHLECGRYEIRGTLGLVPAPEGWGIICSPADTDATITSVQEQGVFTLHVQRDGQPADLLGMISLHLSIEPPRFTPPEVLAPPSPEVPENHDAEHAMARYLELRQMADFKAGPLQDAVDLGEATPEEEAQLLAWKRYRVALNRVPQQAGYPGAIDWPPEPS